MCYSVRIMKTFRGVALCLILFAYCNAKSPHGKDASIKRHGSRRARVDENRQWTPTYATDTDFVQDWNCGTTNRTDPSGVITSPNYPSNYPNEVYCDWTIEAPVGQVIHLTVWSLDLEFHPTCHYDSLGISNSSDPYQGFFLCGQRTCDFVSASNVLHLSFYSDYSITGRGFNVTYQMVADGAMATDECHEQPPPVYTTTQPPPSTPPAEECSVTYLSETSGVISSPNFPGSYPDNAICDWTIAAPNGQVILITVTTLNIESHVTCAWDGLSLHNVPPSSEDQLLCGQLDEPCEFLSTGNLVQVAFRSDGSVTAGGFNVNYEMVDSSTTAHAPECDGVETTNYITPVAWTSTRVPETCAGVSLAGASGVITYPSSSGNYPNFADCDWTIQVEAGQVVRLSLVWIDIEDHPSCIYDWLSFSDPLTSDEATILCGDIGMAAYPCDFVTSGNVARVGFHSDYSVTGGGFTVSYRATTDATLVDGILCL